jgi:hypothetical protein
VTHESNPTPPRLRYPTETRVVGLGDEVLQTIDGPLVLPVGARIHLLAEGVDASVIGVRLVATDLGPSYLVLEVDAGGVSLEAAALQEAEAEAEVVEAAELIASVPLSEAAPPGP